MAEYQAAGKCFNCGEIGHLSQNYPRRNLLPGGSKKPPGVPSYSMEMTLVEDVSDFEDVLESVPLGYLGMRMDHVPGNDEQEDWRSYYPYWQQPDLSARKQIGNCHVMTIKYQLTVQQPYPGDELAMAFPCQPADRFTIHHLKKGGNTFKIQDNLVGFEIEITQDKINEEKFNLGHWYAMKRACLLNLPKPSTEDYPVFMDDPCCLVLLYLLRNGINSHFPNVKPDTEADYRFCVHLMEDHGNPICEIFDSNLNLITEIDKNLLENPEFKLTNGISTT